MITEDIDLTTEQIFASDYNKRLLLDKHYNYHRETNESSVFTAIYSSDSPWIRSISDNDLLFDSFTHGLFMMPEKNHDSYEEQFFAYKRIFGEFMPYDRALSTPWEDPYFAYHAYNGVRCDQCGVDLNALNKSLVYNGCCDDCEGHETDSRRLESVKL